MREVGPLLKHECCQPQLDYSEVVGGLFDPLIKLDMIGEQPFNSIQVSHQASEFAVE